MLPDWFADAVSKGVLTQEESEQLREVERLVAKVIAVDHFDPAELRPNYMTPGHNARQNETSSDGSPHAGQAAAE